MSNQANEEIKVAVTTFNENVSNIHTVEEWANQLEYNSAKSFSRRIKIHFCKPAIKVMTELRIKRIIEIMHRSPEESFFGVARMVGLKDEKSLYDYVKYHTDLSPTALKKKITLEKLRSEITEYNLGVKIPSGFSE
ncbi:helix-turn-helix domain-containing protein [Gracilimonas mengyeensis]|uniref:AraC-type DNA-binding protein n=1 Tax=Gracilimonas mengyeensis TaxID=1302730 RepID=A0A521BN08_9BACT|nr:AraC family transcriptional regulator [Gracilimonas mengyeensis]SMO48513.1 AraC-type DNA-binding protein [Gracilimonas mengyeensis]